ncbi:MAG: sulfatase [Elusimicrobia bacterium]|nr:sulfatase [Candidatus Liberimonas magnetica]
MNKISKYLFFNGIYSGIFFYLFLFVISLLWNAGFSAMGVKQSEVSKFIVSRFWPEVIFIQLKILLAYLSLGLLTGFIVEFIGQNTVFKFKGMKFFLLVFITSYLLIYSIKIYPQLYTETFYDRGGILRSFQVFITDSIPFGFFKTFNYFLCLFFGFSLISWMLRNFKRSLYIISCVLVFVLSVCIVKIIIFPKRYVQNTGPNILILASDSLRFDRVYDRKDLAPNINALIDEGVIFRSHFSSLPRTFPAMISLLTGRFPVHHGVRHMFPDKWNRDLRPYSFVEDLKNAGYSTAVVGDFAGDVFSRMQIGFERIAAPYFNFVTLINQRSLEMHFFLLPYLTNNFARKVFPELKEFANNADPFILEKELESNLNCLKKNEKFFCLTFYSATHFPYAAPYPFYKKYTPDGYTGRYKYHKPPTIYEKEKITEDDIKQINALYDGCVSAFDSSVATAVEYLKKNGLYDNTIIIITADHGENLYENGWSIGHGEHLRGPYAIKLPLIIKFPKNEYAKTKIDCVTREIDVMPTLLEHLGYSKYNAGNKRTLAREEELTKLDGQSLMPVLRKEKDSLGLKAFSETGIWFSDITDGFYQKQRINYPDITGISEVDFTYNLEPVIKNKYKATVVVAKHRMVDDGKYRLIYIPTRDGVKYELYNVGSPDGYLTDISGKNLAKLQELKKYLVNILENNENVLIKD